MSLNLAWFLFYGRTLNMTKQEILHTDYAEMRDMISCFAIVHKGAIPKKRNRHMRFEDVIKLR